MVDFALPPVSPSFEGWGPQLTGDDEAGTVWDFVEHLEKFPLQRISKPVDFSAAGQKYWAERAAKGKGKGKDGKGKGGAPILQLGKDDEGFSLVDNRPIAGKPVKGGRSGGRGKGKGKGLQVNYQEGILGSKTKATYQQTPAAKGKGKGKGGALPRRREPSFRDWSVTTKTEWTIKWEVNLGSLSKPLLDSNQVTFEDLAWCGKLHTYNKRFDRITAKTEERMRRFEDLNFFNVTTSEDPMLKEYLLDDEHGATVIATDHVLAALIAAARSVYSWDIVVQKIAGKLIFDKRDGSTLDYESVNESAPDPPSNDDPESMNAPGKLSQEASCINQNFSQMVLELNKEPEHMEHPNPFTDDEDVDQAASGAYRYRKITMPGNSKATDAFKQEPVTMIVRTEVNGKLADTGGYVSVKALHEYDPKRSNWRNALESQRGACLATEIKNNAFKLGRWTAQAVLAGCDSMKIGYVSRMSPSDPWNHSILGCISHHTDGFADQIGLSQHNMYGILRTFIDTIMEWDDGKYLIMKDPIKPVLRIYDIPWDTFNEDDEDEDEEEEEDPDLDDDGNVRPRQD